MEKTNITISKDIADKIRMKRDMGGYKSLNETLLSLLNNDGISVEEEYIIEVPAFTLNELKIGWEELKKAEIGKKWETDNITATVIYADEQGASIRFTANDEISVKYFHFF